MLELRLEGQQAGWEVRVRAGRASQRQQAVATKPATVRLASGAGRAHRIAWALWLVSLALLVVGGLFLLLSASTPIPPIFGFRGVDLIFGSAFSTVGVVIALRRPTNPIGWLFGTAGLVFAVVGFTGSYAIYAVLTRPGRPLGPEAAWLAQWLWPSSLGAIACVFLLFPDGRLLSPCWRPVLWLAGIAPVIAAIGFALDPGPLTEFTVVDNPFGLEAAGAVLEPAWTQDLSLKGSNRQRLHIGQVIADGQVSIAFVEAAAGPAVGLAHVDQDQAPVGHTW
jgi:hypothetical protein